MANSQYAALARWSMVFAVSAFTFAPTIGRAEQGTPFDVAATSFQKKLPIRKTRPALTPPAANAAASLPAAPPAEVQPIDAFADVEPSGAVVRIAGHEPAPGETSVGPQFTGPQPLEGGVEAMSISDESLEPDSEAVDISDAATAPNSQITGQIEEQFQAVQNAEPSLNPTPTSRAGIQASQSPTPSDFGAEQPLPASNLPAPSAPVVESAPVMELAPAPAAPALTAPQELAPISTPAPSHSPARFEARQPSTAEAGLVTVEWVTPQEVSLGQQLHCQLLVRNTGNSPVQNVRVQASLPKHVQLDSARPKPQREETQLTWQLGEIEGDGSRTIEIELTPKSEGQFSPQATVTCTRITQARIQVLKPEIQIAIHGPEQVISGQMANFEFIVTNPGSGRAHNVVIEAALPEQLKHAEGAKLSYSVGTLGPGESRTVQIALTGAGASGCELSARASAAGGVTAASQCSIEVVRPRLQVALEGPTLRYVDRPAVYTVRVHNPGPAPANNVQVLDAIPPGFRFVEASGGGTFDSASRQVAWFVGRLEANTTAEVGVQLIPTELGEQKVITEVKADSGVSEHAETLTRVDGVEAVALDVIDTDDPVEVNGETVYEIRVTNRGSKDALNVQVAARVATGTEIVDATGPAAGQISGGQVVFDPVASLAPGQCELFQVRVACKIAGEVGFKAYFRTAEQSKAVVEEELTRIYQD